MEKEEVLKLNYVMINDDYTIATITYQNYEILKRYSFNDNELGIKSFILPDFIHSTLYIGGCNSALDNRPIIIPNEDLQFVKEKVKKINEKYGIAKKWRPNMDDDYYTICFDCISNVGLNIWGGDRIDNLNLSKNLIFKTRKEAQFVANKMLENIDKWREEYQNEYNNKK